ncbi:hypothetical protein [Vibrio owensii]|uniref:Uncharacterized protein n=1 Tax=Vibrio owensii CAIM 1854 = LMG 25443 TaxID=1229493 RepID=A0A0C1ZAH1_9VIBR|nr:hypothetical protein [Vibrio owensii]KIF54080.1 hypothetical protein H735_06740 [Vibrio owensii CAIM 1854 = LMG 25443]
MGANFKDPVTRTKAEATRRRNAAKHKSEAETVRISPHEYRLLKQVESAITASNQLGVELNLVLQSCPMRFRKLFKDVDVIGDVRPVLEHLVEQYTNNELSEREKRFTTSLALALFPDTHLGKRFQALTEYEKFKEQEAKEQLEIEQRLDDLFAEFDVE